MLKARLLTIFCILIATQASATSPSLSSEKYISFLRILVRVEADQDLKTASVETSNPFTDLFLKSASAQTSSEPCMIAGYIGEFFSQSCHFPGGVAYNRNSTRITCNPAIFGDLVINKPTGNARWTAACADALLRKLGIEKSLGENLTSTEQQVLSNYIETNKIDVSSSSYLFICDQMKVSPSSSRDCKSVMSLIAPNPSTTKNTGSTQKSVTKKSQNSTVNYFQDPNYNPAPAVFHDTSPAPPVVAVGKKLPPPIADPNTSGACSPIDLNQTSVLKDMPILDQDGSGTCFGFAAAQLIEFKLRSTGAFNAHVSPIDTSLNGSSSDLAEIIKQTTKKGVIDNDCVERAIQNYIGNASITSAEFEAIIAALSENGESKNTKQGIATAAVSPYMKNCDLDATMAQIANLGIWTKSVKKTMSNALSACESSRIKTPHMEYQSTNFGSDQQMLSALDRALVQNKPAGVEGCINSLVRGDAQSGLVNHSASIKRNNDESNVKPACGLHDFLIAGRRPNLGTCQYLIRNSWGANWGNSPIKGLQTCACRTPDGSYYEDCNTLSMASDQNKNNTDLLMQYAQRTYVGCWVDGSSLAANTLEVGSIK